MSAEDNKKAAMEGYEAFGKGDAEAAMANIDDDVEWIVGGDSSLTGSYKGKQEVGVLWAKIVERGFQTRPTEFIAEGDKVVVLTTTSLGGDQAAGVDVLTYNSDGQLTKFETFGDEEMLNKNFPR